MGIACVVNAAGCGRFHCYVTAPLYLLAAMYVSFGEFHLVAMNRGMLLDVVLVLTLLAFLGEFFLGKYTRNGSVALPG